MKTISGDEADGVKEAPMPLYQDPVGLKDEAPKDGCTERHLPSLCVDYHHVRTVFDRKSPRRGTASLLHCPGFFPYSHHSFLETVLS